MASEYVHIEPCFRDLLKCGRTFQSVWGYTFSIDAPLWLLAKGVSVNVANIELALQSSHRPGFRATLAHYARTRSASYTRIIAGRLLALVKSTGGNISCAALINYRSGLSQSREWYIASISGFLCTWHELGYAGVDSDVVDLLKGWRLRANSKGDAVQRRDPLQGPLTDLELQAFNEGLAEGFERGLLTLSDLSLCLLLSHTGRRPRQLAHLKIGDLDHSQRNHKGESVVLLNIPRGKQRSGGFRGEFRSFALDPTLAGVLKRHCNDVIDEAESKLNVTLHAHDRSLLPLFVDWSSFESVKSVTELRALTATDRLHITVVDIKERLKRAVKQANMYSERTGSPLKTNPRRFRYTTGSRAAREGCGLAVIAEILDHSDTANAKVYVRANPEHVALIDAAVGHELAPLARAFRGELVDDETGARRGDDASSRVRHRGAPMATCGLSGACAARVPIPCYTCIHFQPWLDGPHQRVLDELILEQGRILKDTGDAHIAAINDRTILAVIDVIQRCDKRRVQLQSVPR